MTRALLILIAAWPLCAGTFYLTVAGLGGEPDYEQRFQAWAKDTGKALGGTVLCGPEATRANVQAALRQIAAQAKPDDALVLTLIGHGGVDGTEYKVNLPGPDVTASELRALLDAVPASRQLVVNMTSASGASLDALRRPNRTVITATKTGTEKNATVFARYWVEALRDPAADTDKNETVSALEAYRYADAKTAKFYETQKRLATEHALLDGVRAPSPENGQGLLAGRIALVRLAAARQQQDPKLLAKKEDLEQRIDKLKYEKAAMPADEYKKQLTALLLELAKTQAELDK